MAINVLLTGGTGFLGKILHTALEQPVSGWCVDTLGRGAGADYEYDLQNDGSLRLNKAYDMVIHAAGKAHVVPKTAAEKEAFFKVNLEGTKHLCEVLERNGLTKSFVFISTVAVYGVDAGENISEVHTLGGTTPYAQSKIQAEHWLQEWAARHNVVLSILRLPLVAGPEAPGNLGAMVNGIRSGKYLRIGKAQAKKSVVWAADIAGIMPALLHTGGIFNLTDGRHPSFSDLEESISSALHKSSPRSIPMGAAKLLALAGDVVGNRFPINSDKLNKITSTLTFSDNKARTQLGWHPSSVTDRLSAAL